MPQKFKKSKGLFFSVLLVVILLFLWTFRSASDDSQNETNERISSNSEDQDQIQSESKSVQRISQLSETKKARQILEAALQAYPNSMKEPVYSYVMGSTILETSADWTQEKLKIESQIAQFSNSEVQEIKNRYQALEDPFINQRFLEVVYKSSAERSLKIEFLVARWFDLPKAQNADSRLAIHNTMTNSVILLAQLQPQIQLEEIQTEIRRQKTQLKPEDRKALKESLDAYLPSLAHRILGVL